MLITPSVFQVIKLPGCNHNEGGPQGKENLNSMICILLIIKEKKGHVLRVWHIGVH